MNQATNQQDSQSTIRATSELLDLTGETVLVTGMRGRA